MLRKWYFPSWSGDYRLEAEGEACTLTVVDPTPSELEQLDEFLGKARERGWIRPSCGIADKGETCLRLTATVDDAGHVLLGDRYGKARLTAVRSEAGKVSILSAVEQQPNTTATPPAPEEAAAAADTKEPNDKSKKKGKGEDAVTVRRPTLCCPTPVPGPDVRASEVLRAFCTPQQWQDWMQKGFLHCRGGLTGRLYRVVHRHNPLAQRQGKIVYDIEGGHVLHAYDWSVPPAEEALTMKLVLEHRENWIRNRSGNYIDGDENFHNPFVGDNEQGLDGTWDASFMTSFGHSLTTMLAGMARDE